VKDHRQWTTLVADGLIDEMYNGSAAGYRASFEARTKFLVDVLCRLPPTDYEALKARCVWFFVPAAAATGWTGPIPAGKLEIVYLSPFLEPNGGRKPILSDTQDWILIIAHEVAHALLGHAQTPISDAKEKEAWDKVAELELVSAERFASFRKEQEERSKPPDLE
jgi:hypothetical protein